MGKIKKKLNELKFKRFGFDALPEGTKIELLNELLKSPIIQFNFTTSKGEEITHFDSADNLTNFILGSSIVRELYLSQIVFPQIKEMQLIETCTNADELTKQALKEYVESYHKAKEDSKSE